MLAAFGDWRTADLVAGVVVALVGMVGAMLHRRRTHDMWKQVEAMTATIKAFERSPDRGKGLAREMPVRWALEKMCQPYDVRLLSFQAMKKPTHLALQPFGQIPTYEDGGLALFESGAIVLHVAGGHAGLLPADRDARARAIAWMVAAVATMEPPIVERSLATLFEREKPWHEKPWHEKRLPLLDGRVRARLNGISRRLGDADWLDGDLMMVSVLRRLHGSGILDEVPNVAAYVVCGESRPAFQRAFKDQLSVFATASQRG